MQTDDTNRSAREAQDQGYDGWANYETWCVSLWLNNDPGLYTWIEGLKCECDHPTDLAAAIRDFVEEGSPVMDDATVYGDLLNGALRAVDWFEIADSFMAA